MAGKIKKTVLTAGAALLMTASFPLLGQIGKENKYDWSYIREHVREAKSITEGTRRIIQEITKKYSSDSQQRELIEFYKTAYDYKIVDRGVLKNIIDSLAVFGINDEVKTLAVSTRNFIEHRLLTQKIRDFNFPDKNGKYLSLSSLRDKIVIVELWASWCGPCIREMPKIPNLRKRNPNVEFYSISLDESLPKMKKFVDKKGYDWPLVLGGDENSNKDLWDYLHIVAIPKYYTVDRDGTIIHIADRLDEEYVLTLK